MSTPPRLSAFGPGPIAWVGVGAAVLAALMAFEGAPLAALVALAGGGACALAAMAARADTGRTSEAREAERRGGDLAPLAPLLEALPDAAMLVNADGHIVGANAAARRRFGFEALDLRLSSILRQPDLLDAAQDAAREGASRTIEFETSGAQTEEQIRAYVAPVQWAETRAALIVFHDETARVTTERLRSDFLANASHELRTPLAALMVLIETLSGPAKDSEADRARFLAMMQTQADRMRRLIDDLLSLSRIELDEHVPPSDRADLAVVVREAVDTLSGLASERGIVLKLIEADQSAMVVGHRFQLVQVVQNLLDNAIKYSPDGGVVEVELGRAANREAAIERAGRRWPEAGRIALLTPAAAPSERACAFVRVTDSGPGVPRRFLPKLGARFFRVEREMGADRGGTGLGLAIVKHIMNRHRGGVLVESEPGRGAAFAIYLEQAA